VSVGLDSVEESLRTIAAWGLPGAPPPKLPDNSASYKGFPDRVHHAQLTGPLLSAAAAGDLVLPKTMEAELLVRHERALLWCLELETRLLQVRELFDGAGGIRFLVIKGPAVAHLDAMDPSVRTFADIDLLVSERDWERAVEILNRAGATPPWAERRRGFNRNFAKGTTRTFPDGVEFDLHRTLSSGVHGQRIPLPELFELPGRLELGGITFEVLQREHRLLHSAYHLLLGSREPALSSLRDFGGYLHDEALGPASVVPVAERWRGTAVLAKAIDLLVATLDTQPPESWLEWRDTYSVCRGEAELIERERREGASLGSAQLDMLLELSTFRKRAAFIGALVWPSRAHLRSRSLRRSDIARSLTRLRRGAGRSDTV
jgi:hypothetical protein